MNHTGEILILTGTPGSGKTTTAQTLAGEPGSSKVHLHSDDFWHFIKNGAIQPYLPEAHDQNTVVLDVLAQAAEGYARGGYFVIVDGIVGPWFLAPFKKIPVPVHYVVLRPALDVAIRRCQERGGNTLTDPGPITELHKQRHCCKVSDEAAFCLIQRPYISKTLLTRRISPRGSP
ncbi:AAA family ATPase [Escherichia coli]